MHSQVQRSSCHLASVYNCRLDFELQPLVMSQNLPSAIKSSFSLNSDVHSHYTSQASNFDVPYTRTSLAHKTIKHEGPILWNMLNQHLRVSKNIFICNHDFKSDTLDSYCG